MKYDVTGPDGETHTLEAASEAALFDAIEQMWKDDKEPSGTQFEVNGMKIEMPAILDVLERIASRPDPDFPKMPESKEVDFAPVLAALKRLDREPAPDNGEALGRIESAMGELCGAVDGLRAETDQLRKAFLDAIQALHATVAAPRELIRDKSGKALRSEVVT